MFKISKYFTSAEVVTTQHREIDNTPPEAMWDVLCATAEHMDEVRILLGVPVHVNSWYRCHTLNVAVGSKNTSQHTKGEAVDFIVPTFGNSLEVVRFLARHVDTLDFDQLILEHAWVHISWKYNSSAINRKQVLTLLQDGSYAAGITDKKGIRV